MKVSLNTVKLLTEVDLPTDELVHKINQQLGGVEEITDLGARYKGTIIVKIVSCEDHPDADRLHVCKIDDGGVTEGIERDGDNLVQVVCGAPNARAGISVVWLPPGSTVPSSFATDEPFVLEVRPLRGVASNGMLASPRELGIGDNHEGILEIDSDKAPGTSFAEAYGLNDVIIDIENKMFTHRPDCFGVLGVAREIAGIQGKPFTSPDWYANEPQFSSAEGLNLEVNNEITDVVPRFMAVAVKDVTVKPSPLWLQIELVRLGSRPINNIVDITNYVMLLTGQPLHAYDYDKVAHGTSEDGAVLGVRLAHDGETVPLLNGKTTTLASGDIIITDGNKPIGIGGVMGGSETEVSDETKHIILECASFDMYTIRKTSMRHGLFTDAVTRFNKGQSPLQNPYVVAFALSKIYEVAGGSQASQVIDVKQNVEAPQPLTTSTDFINQRLGLNLSADEMCDLLNNVEFQTSSNGNLVATPPFWRTDIELPEDLVEEIGRLYGFDKLPRELPQRSIKPAAKNAVVELKHALRAQLSRLGANEVLTYSFVHENVLTRTGQDPEIAYKLGNALSPDLQYYRLSLTPSLLGQVHPNSKAGYDAFALFEFGKAHATTEVDEDGLPREFNRLALVFAAQDKAAVDKFDGAPYYQARNYLDELLRATGQSYAFQPLATASYDGHALLEQMTKPFEPNRSAVLWNGEYIVGVVGEYKPSVAKAFKLPKFSAGFEIFLSALEQQTTEDYTPLPRFPKVWQDLSLRVPATVNYQQLYDTVHSSLNDQESDTMLSNLQPTSIYQSPDDLDHKNVTFRYSVASHDKTMTDTEVSAMLDNVVKTAAEALQAERV